MRGVVLACVTFLALAVGIAGALWAQGTRPSQDSLASLSVVSKPSGNVAIGHSIVGETPKSLSISAGTHTILISRAGYRSYERTIVLEAGEVPQTRELRAQRACVRR